MRPFQKLFIVDTSKRPLYKVVLWWEYRRIFYNFYLVIFGWLSLNLISIFWNEGHIRLYPEPALVLGVYFLIVIFFLGANFCYTFGWVVQLLTRSMEKEFITKHTQRLFIYGLIVTLAVISAPVLFIILYGYLV